jgi:diguanylate cyclase (GGDEF)-like protein
MAAHLGWDQKAHKRLEGLVLKAEQSPLAFEYRRSHPGAADPVARFGGDEFVILAQSVNDETGLKQLTERVLDAFAEPVTMAGTTVTVRLSVDGTLYAAGERSEDVLNRADGAMYRVKRARRLLAADSYRNAP